MVDRENSNKNMWELNNDMYFDIKGHKKMKLYEHKSGQMFLTNIDRKSVCSQRNGNIVQEQLLFT